MTAPPCPHCGAVFVPGALCCRVALALLPDRIAFLYTATERGSCSGIRFALTVDEAMTWCESDLSRGVLHGTAWVYLWTRVSTYCRVFGADLDLTRAIDNGAWDARIAGLGLTKIGLDDLPALLAPAGITVRRPGMMALPQPAPRRVVGAQLSLGLAA